MTAFKDCVEGLVNTIPAGMITSYGHIAVACGKPRAARHVGRIAHYGDPSLPWHRVVRKDGGLARGYPGGMRAQQVALESEGIEVDGFVVQDMERHTWKQ